MNFLFTNRHVKVGDKICEFDTIAQVQSDKATTEITSPYSGTILKVYNSEGDTVKTGQPLLSIDVDEEQTSLEDTNIDHDSHTKDLHPGKIKKSQILATPRVRNLAETLKIDLEKTIGTGNDGRILEADLMAQNLAPKVHRTPIQRAMFKQMQKSLSIPHFSYSEFVDMTLLFKCKAETGISVSAYMLKALSKVVKETPMLNHIIVDEDVQKSNEGNSIGLAIDTPLGLVVPIIPEIDTMTLDKLSVKLHKDVIPRARRNHLNVHETNSKNACITLSNVGAAFSEKGSHQETLRYEMPANAMPRILHPQVDIVAITRAVKQQSTGKMMGRACWSADHRIVDGVTLAKASRKFKVLLENPQIICNEL